MKQLILTAILSIIGTFTFSQEKITLSKEFSYDVSKPYPVTDAGIKTYFGKEGEVLSIKVDGKVVYIQKYEEKTLKQISSKVYEDFDKGFVTENIVNFANKYFLFYSAWDKPNKKEQLFVREVDFDKGQFTGKSTKLITVDGKVTGGDGNKFQIETSFDESKLLIRYRQFPESKKDNVNKDIIGMFVYDGNLEQIWGKSVKMPYTESQMNNIDYAVNNKGTAFILSEVLPNGEKNRLNKDKTPNFKIKLLSITGDNGIEANDLDVEIKGKMINQVGFFEGPKDELILAGYYGNKSYNNVDGIFMFKMTETGEMSDAVNFEIPTEIIKQYKSDKAQKKMDKKEDEGYDYSLSNMVLRDLSVAEDGSIVMVGEKYYAVTTYNSKGQSSTTYYYQEMLISKINSDGSLGWMRKLPKNQVGRNSGTSSLFTVTFTLGGGSGLGFKYINNNDAHYLLFLDNVKNINLKDNEVPKAHQDGAGGFLTGYRIDDKTGEVKKLSILDTKDAKGTELFQFQPTRIVNVSENVFGLECYKKDKEDVMIKITLNDK